MGIVVSSSAWNMAIGGSPRPMLCASEAKPPTDSAAPTVEEYPGLPLLPGSSGLNATLSTFIAPAELPIRKIQLGLIRYLAALALNQRTAARTSHCASFVAPLFRP